MAIVSGSVLFDQARTAAPPTGMPGIANVPVVLQDVSSGMMLTVLSNDDGDFSFINVPSGNYRLVEAYHLAGVASPADFTTAAVGPVPHAVVPPISYVTYPPEGATNLDCTIPNTLLFTVGADNVSGLYICNGPVRYIPIESVTDPCAVIDPHNILVDAVYGTMGTFPQGTPANTGTADEPFPQNVPDFEYTLPLMPPNNHSPDDGQYTVQNIMNADYANTTWNTWWVIADHTEGNETGRMMVVNGYQPGSVFFTSDVAVEPDTYYLFSVWMLNLYKILGYADPALGVQVLDEDGNVVFAQTLGAQIPVNLAMPEWKQIGTAIYTGEHSNLTVQFLSEGPAAWGNDYAIDDIRLQEIRIPVFTPHKSCSTQRLAVGETATFTVRLQNTCTSPLTSVFIQDAIPQGLDFVQDSVTINGQPQAGLDPQDGFDVPDVAGHDRVTITFDVVATAVPSDNPVTNQADMSYAYTPVEDGASGTFNVTSNPVRIRINPAVCNFAFVAMQRERNITADVSGIITFDTPLYSSQAVVYQPDGNIDITVAGTFIVSWFVAGKFGFATDGQHYDIRWYDRAASAWQSGVGATNHIKNGVTIGFAIVVVTDDDITNYGRATFALFNTADADIELTTFLPKAGIMVYGANFGCIDNQMTTISNNLYDINQDIVDIERFLFLSDVETIMSETPELASLGVSVIFIGFSYNFWGVGTLDAPVTLNADEVYYLIRSEQYQPLTLYQGDPTIGTLWIEAANGSFSKFPLRMDGTGIYVIPIDPLTLGAGTRFSFTQSLILVG